MLCRNILANLFVLLLVSNLSEECCCGGSSSLVDTLAALVAAQAAAGAGLATALRSEGAPPDVELTPLQTVEATVIIDNMLAEQVYRQQNPLYDLLNPEWGSYSSNNFRYNSRNRYSSRNQRTQPIDVNDYVSRVETLPLQLNPRWNRLMDQVQQDYLTKNSQNFTDLSSTMEEQLGQEPESPYPQSLLPVDSITAAEPAAQPEPANQPDYRPPQWPLFQQELIKAQQQVELQKAQELAKGQLRALLGNLQQQGLNQGPNSASSGPNRYSSYGNNGLSRRYGRRWGRKYYKF